MTQLVDNNVSPATTSWAFVLHCCPTEKHMSPWVVSIFISKSLIHSRRWKRRSENKLPITAHETFFLSFLLHFAQRMGPGEWMDRLFRQKIEVLFDWSWWASLVICFFSPFFVGHQFSDHRLGFKRVLLCWVNWKLFRFHSFLSRLLGTPFVYFSVCCPVLKLV